MQRDLTRGILRSDFGFIEQNNIFGGLNSQLSGRGYAALELTEPEAVVAFNFPDIDTSVNRRSSSSSLRVFPPATAG